MTDDIECNAGIDGGCGACERCDPEWWEELRVVELANDQLRYKREKIVIQSYELSIEEVRSRMVGDNWQLLTERLEARVDTALEGRDFRKYFRKIPNEVLDHIKVGLKRIVVEEYADGYCDGWNMCIGPTWKDLAEKLNTKGPSGISSLDNTL